MAWIQSQTLIPSDDETDTQMAQPWPHQAQLLFGDEINPQAVVFLVGYLDLSSPERPQALWRSPPLGIRTWWCLYRAANQRYLSSVR